MPLFADKSEDVRLEVWQPNQKVQRDASNGIELFVLEGGFTEAARAFGQWDWVRLPPDSLFRG